MKNSYILLIPFLFLLSCKHPEPSIKEEKKLLKINPKQQVQPIPTEIWGLTNYLDTIIEEKELAKYRLQLPSWFGILLEISHDSITSYGSIIEIEDQLNQSKDTLYKFKSFAGKWVLLKREENLILKQIPAKNKNADSITYVYRRRDDLKFLLDEMDNVHKISTNITHFFNKELLSGLYHFPKTKQEVEFSENGTLRGIENFTHFQVRDYFGTSHPHKNLDVVILKNSEDKSLKEFNWKFDKNRLILTEFIFDIPNENYILGKQKIVLEKKN